MAAATDSIPVTCPDCLSSDVMPSMPQGMLERFLFNAFLIYRFRCRACLHRFSRRKVGVRYHPPVGLSRRAVWSFCISIIAVSAISIGTMAVRARLLVVASRPQAIAPPAAQPEKPSEGGMKFSVTDDVSAEKKAHAQFMNNFQAAPEPKKPK